MPSSTIKVGRLSCIKVNAKTKTVSLERSDNDSLKPTQFSVIRQLKSVPLPLGFQDQVKRQGTRVEVVGNERALLNFLMANLHRVDPDIIVGHNFIDFDLDVLLHRMKSAKVDSWSRIGRLRRSKYVLTYSLTEADHL